MMTNMSFGRYEIGNVIAVFEFVYSGRTEGAHPSGNSGRDIWMYAIDCFSDIETIPKPIDKVQFNIRPLNHIYLVEDLQFGFNPR